MYFDVIGMLLFWKRVGVEGKDGIVMLQVCMGLYVGGV